jgi:hypothetical protein
MKLRPREYQAELPASKVAVDHLDLVDPEER